MGIADQLSRYVHQTALSRGSSGRAWLGGLDGQISAACRRWDLTVLSVMSGGSEACVVEVARGDGSAAVLKLAPPESQYADEIETLRLADGRGYARLYAYDIGERALLLERLGPNLADLGWTLEQQLTAISATLAVAWGAVPPRTELTTGDEKAAWLADMIGPLWEAQGRPCQERTIVKARDFADRRRRAHDPAAAVVVHGDAHAWNMLLAPDGGGFKLVDPDGLVAERAYDLAIPMREWSDELLAGDPLRLGRERCHLLARLSGLEPQAIWEWGLVERVATGLLAIELGTDEGRPMLAVADVWALET